MILSSGADFEIPGRDTSTSVLPNGRFGTVRSLENIRKYEKHWETPVDDMWWPYRSRGSDRTGVTRIPVLDSEAYVLKWNVAL